MRVAPKSVWFLSFIGTCFILPRMGMGAFLGDIKVYARDSSTGNFPPPTTSADLAGSGSLAFGTSDQVVFSGSFEAGIHEVGVSTGSKGYLLRQSPTDPNAINDPYSAYGNPRYVELSENTNDISIYFQFDPVVTAMAKVRDAGTMEPLDNVEIEFGYHVSTNTIAVSKYPWTAVYATNWTTDAAGNFPTNTILYIGDYDVTVSKNGYQSFTEAYVISNAQPGDAIDLGTIYMAPVDTNANLIADAWEATYFGAGITVAAAEDADNDGISNFDEYIAGTNPTNGQDCLHVSASLATNGFVLSWNVEPYRTYRVCGTTNLCTGPWVQVGGSWEATNGQSKMVWVETNMDLSWNSLYRVEVVNNWCQETNQVLINTNMPHSTGSGTNSWSGGPPPIPGS